MNASWSRRGRARSCDHSVQHHRPTPPGRALHRSIRPESRRRAIALPASSSPPALDRHRSDARTADVVLKGGDAAAILVAFTVAVPVAGDVTTASLLLLAVG